MPIKKEKNFIVITIVENGKEKTSKCDINTREFYGVSGKSVKALNSKFIKEFKNEFDKNSNKWYGNRQQKNTNSYVLVQFDKYLNNRSWYTKENVVERLKVADHIDNLGIEPCEDYWRAESFIDSVMRDTKAFDKFFNDKEYQAELGVRDNRELVMYYPNHQDDIAFHYSSNGFTYDEHFTERVAKDIVRRIDRKYWKLAEWYCRRGGIYQYYALMGNDWQFANALNDYFHTCELLGIEPQKNTNFMLEFIKVKETYNLMKEELDDKAVKQNQEKVEDIIFFENEDFITLIPKTTKEFYDEAEYQNNCLYRMYLPRVVEGRTNIVFVRDKKNLDHPLITCEVHNGKIIQYLARFNHKVTDSDLLDFQYEYEKHLRENWVR